MSGDLTAQIAGLLGALRAGVGAVEGPAWFERKADLFDRIAEEDPLLAEQARQLAEQARVRARQLRRGGGAS